MNFKNWIAASLWLLTLTLLLAQPVFAEDQDASEMLDAIVKEESGDTSVRYAPDGCDFEMTFPDQTYTSKRCPEGTGKCYDLTGYTMVYDLSTTVEVSVTCVPSTPENFVKYNDRVIRAALNGMVERVGLTEFNINTKEDEDIRQGSLIGTGNYGKQSRIYNAQLWIGQNSVFTVEAKLSGRSHPEADTVFGDILDSMQKKRPPKEVLADDEKEKKKD